MAHWKEILPEVSGTDPGTFLKARFEVDNKVGKLTPGMLLRLMVSGPSTERLVVSSESVIRTGKRAVVILRNGKGGFEPRDLSLGRDYGDDVEVVSGLNAGDQVVASGQFLIDSEARLRSVARRNTATVSPMRFQPPGTKCIGRRRLTMAWAQGGKHHAGEADDLAWAHRRHEVAGHDDGLWQGGPEGVCRHPRRRQGRFRFKEGGASGYEQSSMEGARRGHQVIAALIRCWSVVNRFLVLIGTLFLVAAGVFVSIEDATRRTARPVGHQVHRPYPATPARRRKSSRIW